MTLRLTFHRDSILSPGSRHRDLVLEGDTFTELVGKWNALPTWNDLGNQEFREKLAEMTGGRVEWSATDEELVYGVVEAANTSEFSDGMSVDGTPRA